MRIKVGFILLAVALGSCSKYPLAHKSSIPALEYSNYIKNKKSEEGFSQASQNSIAYREPRIKPETLVRSDKKPSITEVQSPADQNNQPKAGLKPEIADFSEQVFRAALQDQQSGGYSRPLSLGDPGVSSSLWRDSTGSPDFFRDQRAWQPMDLVTVRISENSEGKKEADTELKSQTDIFTSIKNLLGLEEDIENSNSKVEFDNLVQASTKQDFKGEGETTRKDELTGTISCMVMEVLPSGILRIEGTKIISINNEEQTMVLSGLVRTRDVSSENQVESARVANMRIDYYGQGQIGNVQREGWLGTIMRKVWPF